MSKPFDRFSSQSDHLWLDNSDFTRQDVSAQVVIDLFGEKMSYFAGLMGCPSTFGCHSKYSAQ